ncbi:phage terminase large subunit [Geobacter sp. SVR]|uniref:phage terminase large subunit n=1 Tax=Geobacter sp. SVR TaxID=2495594 RepID=UPI00143F035A|nr:phage terminase large subunit [Geobacter sp. SVR]BCS53294.1 hypothetical protein GSVR_16020 [Geobacter sp. SVR]GCF85580.1 hypothetical protein GSbR_21800 [Geobacter sp. SVR]
MAVIPQKKRKTRDELLAADFKNFLYAVWKFLGLPSPTPIQYEIADWLQFGPKRKMIGAFRGEGKSWITSAYVLWVLRYKDRNHKFEIVSASKSRADDFTTFTKRLIADMPELKCLKPKNDQRDSMVSFDVNGCKPAHAPSVKSVGIFGQLTGSRADELIADDIEVAQNSATQDSREKLEKATQEFEAIIVPGGKITYLGTPQSEESVYNKLPSKGYAIRIWPARVPKPAAVGKYNGQIAPSILALVEQGKSGLPTDPTRFTDEDLIEREMSYGRAGFLLQFMLDTSLADAERYPLKTSDLIIMNLLPDKGPIAVSYGSSPELQLKDLPNVGFSGDRYYRPMFVDKEWSPYEGTMMFIDPSGRGKDETGYAIVKQLHGYLFITAAGGFKGGYDDTTLMQLALVAREHKVNYIQIEPNFGDGMFLKIFTPVLKAVHPCTCEDAKRAVAQKEKRIIDTLEPVMNRHRLIMCRSVIEEDLKVVESEVRYSLLYQLTHITKERGALKHDDRLDALAGAVAYWVDSMAKDEKESQEAYKDAQLEAALQQFMEHAIGGVKNGPNWLKTQGI